MTQTETLKLAISRLEWFIDSYPHDITVSKEDFLRPFKEALAQPEQEPVAWMYPDALCDRSCLYVCTKAFTQFPECANTPPQRTWVGLTDEERKEIERQSVYVEGAIRMTEAKLKEKNTK